MDWYEEIEAGWAPRHGYDGRGVGVAILDTGIAPHVDLDGRIFGFFDVIHGRTRPYDDGNHGTHVAGIIAGSGRGCRGRYTGVAPGCRLVGVKVLNEKGQGMVPHMLLGIHWILENKDRYNIRILNISIGTKEEEQYGEESALVKGVEEAWDQGIVVIAAAANNGPGEGTIGSPGISRKIITVGSTEGEIRRSRKGMRRYLYSGCGPTRGCVVKPDLLAPGSRIISCGNTRQGYVTKSGTSMSTPMVSGAAALLLQKHPELTNKEVKERLWECGDDLHLPLTVQGRGRLNIRALLCPESGE